MTKFCCWKLGVPVIMTHRVYVYICAFVVRFCFFKTITQWKKGEAFLDWVSVLRATEGSRLSWPGWLGEMLRWFAHLKTVTHLSTNRVQRRVTLLILPKTLPLCQTATTFDSGKEDSWCVKRSKRIWGHVSKECWGQNARLSWLILCIWEEMHHYKSIKRKLEALGQCIPMPRHVLPVPPSGKSV